MPSLVSAASTLQRHAETHETTIDECLEYLNRKLLIDKPECKSAIQSTMAYLRMAYNMQLNMKSDVIVVPTSLKNCMNDLHDATYDANAVNEQLKNVEAFIDCMFKPAYNPAHPFFSDPTNPFKSLEYVETVRREVMVKVTAKERGISQFLAFAKLVVATFPYTAKDVTASVVDILKIDKGRAIDMDEKIHEFVMTLWEVIGDDFDNYQLKDAFVDSLKIKKVDDGLKPDYTDFLHGVMIQFRSYFMARFECPFLNVYENGIVQAHAKLYMDYIDACIATGNLPIPPKMFAADTPYAELVNTWMPRVACAAIKQACHKKELNLESIVAVHNIFWFICTYAGTSAFPRLVRADLYPQVKTAIQNPYAYGMACERTDVIIDTPSFGADIETVEMMGGPAEGFFSKLMDVLQTSCLQIEVATRSDRRRISVAEVEHGVIGYLAKRYKHKDLYGNQILQAMNAYRIGRLVGAAPSISGLVPVVATEEGNDLLLEMRRELDDEHFDDWITAAIADEDDDSEFTAPPRKVQLKNIRYRTKVTDKQLTDSGIIAYPLQESPF